MKIILIVTPNFSIKMLTEEVNNLKKGICDFTKSIDWRPAPPIGLLYIASSIRNAGYDVQIYDLHRSFYICRENGFFQNNGISDFFNEFFDRKLKESHFNVIGISCLFNVSSSTMEELSIRAKRILPFAKIVIGGHYPTIMYRDILKKGFIDYIILGEAENEFIWLLDNLKDSALDEKIKNKNHIVDRNNINNLSKRNAIIENLDRLPMPSWDILPHVSEYITHSIDGERVGSVINKKVVRSASIFTTRGCPMKCTFCAAHGVHGRYVRVHSIDYIMRHIDWLVTKFDINNLLIQDDMFNFSTKRAIEFCNKIFDQYKNRFNIEFPNGLAVWKLNDELILKLKKIGLKTITIAIESGSQYVQDNILKKRLNLSDVKKTVELLQDNDINIRAFFIVGFLGESIEMMQETVNYALSLNIDWSEIKIYTPLVGSEMYEIAKKQGVLTQDTSEHVYGRACIKTPEFTPEQIKDIQYDANIRVNFLNNRYLNEKKYEQAEQIFRGLLNRFPNHIFAQWALWKALKGLKKNDESNQALIKLNNLIKESKQNQLLIKKYNIDLMANWGVQSLTQYVTKCENKNIGDLQEKANEWLKVSAENKIDYEIEWLGIPIIQTAEDLILMQELIFKIKPDYIIDVGIAHGGSLIYYASILELLGNGKVIGIDIDIRKHNREVIESHPLFKRIDLIQGSSISKDVIQRLKKIIAANSITIVCLDSNHYREHVFKELNLYKKFLPIGSYIVVFDTNTSILANQGACDKSYINNGPLEAINDFLKINNDFIIDKSFNKLYTSTSRDGYLKRIK